MALFSTMTSSSSMRVSLSMARCAISALAVKIDSIERSTICCTSAVIRASRDLRSSRRSTKWWDMSDGGMKREDMKHEKTPLHVSCLHVFTLRWRDQSLPKPPRNVILRLFLLRRGEHARGGIVFDQYA